MDVTIFLIGLLAGFLAGGGVCYYDVKSRAKRGYTPYIDIHGTLRWMWRKQ